MSMKKGREYRNTVTPFDAPGENNEELILRGTPVVFDSPTCLYEIDGIKYYEIIDRNAFNDCDFSDFIFNYNHGGRVYARNRNKSLTYEITQTGINCEVRLDKDDEGHRQLYRDIASGRIDKMSFSFSIGASEYNEDTRTRRITRVKKLYDFSAVDFPAYEDTAISARGFFEAEYSKELEALEQMQVRRRLIAKTYLF